MTHIKLASKAMEMADLQNATQIAYSETPAPFKDGKAHKNAVKRVEKAASRLSDAAEELENLLNYGLSERAMCDLHEVLGQIVETQRLVAAAHARMRQTGA